jgi:hypothetical protein
MWSWKSCGSRSSLWSWKFSCGLCIEIVCRLQTTWGRKQWKYNKFCQFCRSEESVDHLMFECPIAVFMWAVIRDGLKWGNVPKSMRDFKENFLQIKGNKGLRATWFLFGCVCWVLRLNRNDCIFNNKIISSPRAIWLFFAALTASSGKTELCWSWWLKSLGPRCLKSSWQPKWGDWWWSLMSALWFLLDHS